MTTIVDTYPGWKRLGYQVKHGEKALFKTKIWKPVSRKNKNTGNEGVNEDHMFLVSFYNFPFIPIFIVTFFIFELF